MQKAGSLTCLRALLYLAVAWSRSSWMLPRSMSCFCACSSIGYEAVSVQQVSRWLEFAAAAPMKPQTGSLYRRPTEIPCQAISLPLIQLSMSRNIAITKPPATDVLEAHVACLMAGLLPERLPFEVLALLS